MTIRGRIVCLMLGVPFDYSTMSGIPVDFLYRSAILMSPGRPYNAERDYNEPVGKCPSW